MGRKGPPATAAVRFLKDRGVACRYHPYRYEDRGGTRVAAAALGVDEHRVIKTLVFETDTRELLLVLMHGDRAVSEKRLARHLGVKQVRPCPPAAAERATGYSVGGISPLGTRRAMMVLTEPSVLALDTLYLNGGRRGLMVELAGADLATVLSPETARISISPEDGV